MSFYRREIGGENARMSAPWRSYGSTSPCAMISHTYISISRFLMGPNRTNTHRGLRSFELRRGRNGAVLGQSSKRSLDRRFLRLTSPRVKLCPSSDLSGQRRNLATSSATAAQSRSERNKKSFLNGNVRSAGYTAAGTKMRRYSRGVMPFVARNWRLKLAREA